MQGGSLIVKKVRYFIYLHIILALFSVSAILSKMAAGEKAPKLDLSGGVSGFFNMDTSSFKWMMYYAGILFIMFVYAIAWQQIIKRMPIVTAYANKAVLVIWGIIWGLVFFGEKITAPKIIGAVIIIAGVWLVVTGDEYRDEEDTEP